MVISASLRCTTASSKLIAPFNEAHPRNPSCRVEACYLCVIRSTPVRTSSFLRLIVVLVGLGGRALSGAQNLEEWNDALVDHMTGTWKLEGQIMGHAAHHEVQAEWVLNHQFLRIHEKTDLSAPASERRYEAIWFLGYDSVSHRYVLHLLDLFGARFSETLGYGTREGNAIRFVFEYPDGPFHTAYRWAPQSDSWQWLMEQKDKNAKWVSFADLSLKRSRR